MTDITNPHKMDIDLSNKFWIWMHTKATTGLAKGKKYNLFWTNIWLFYNQVKQTCNIYAWDQVGTTICVFLLEVKNLVQEHNSITLDMVKESACRTWGTMPRNQAVDKTLTNSHILQLHLWSSMMGHWIMASLDKNAIHALVN